MLLDRLSATRRRIKKHLHKQVLQDVHAPEGHFFTVLLTCPRDEFLLADLCVSLMVAGAIVVGPGTTAWRCFERAAIGQGHRCSGRIDLDLRGEDGSAVADALASRGIPFVFATAYSAIRVPERHAHVTMCGKPMDLRVVASVLVREVGNSSRDLKVTIVDAVRGQLRKRKDATARSCDRIPC